MNDKERFYRKRFRNLAMKERRRRMLEFAKDILAACIDRKEFREDREDYLCKNEELAIDVISVMDGIREAIEKKMMMDFKLIEDRCTPLIESDKEGNTNEIDLLDKQGAEVAVSLLGKPNNRNGYTRLKYQLNSFVDLPSYYILTKNRPAIVPIQLKLRLFDSSDLCVTPNEVGIVEARPEGSEMLNNEVPAHLEEEQALIRSSQVKDTIEGAKIEGGYVKYIELLDAKHQKNNIIVNEKNNVLVIDSIDGAEHLKSKKKVISVISFSTSMFDPTWINTNVLTAGTSLNILTWQQLRGTESYSTMMPAVEEYFASKKKLQDDTLNNSNHKWRNFHFYDLHNGKMLCLLVQHSLWNRKNFPFLLCKCKRGQGVDENHTCIPINMCEEMHLRERSVRRWDKKRRVIGVEKYHIRIHMDWVDQHNDGVSHFGVSPELLPRDTLRMDVFHMKCSITKNLMGYLRALLFNQAGDITHTYASSVLLKFWNDLHLYVWKNNKPFSSFQGNELALFVANIPQTNNFLQYKLVRTNKVDNVIKALQLWFDLFKFLGITKNEDEEEYIRKLDYFKVQLKEFYKVGVETFLTKHGVKGGDETFYLHTLRFYIPCFARITFEYHKLGIGIFNMQGFERRNKESKNCMKRFTNNVGNVIPNNLRRVWDIFEHNVNAV